MRRTTLLISIALMLAVIAAACGSAESKPAAGPTAPSLSPTPMPTVTVEAQAADENASTDNTSAGGAGFADPGVQECLAEQLGENFDPDSGDTGRNLFGLLGSDEFTAALETCGVDAEAGFGTAFGGFGDRRGGGGAFRGGGFGGGFTPEAQECLTERLGEDFAGGFGGRDGGSGGRGGGGQFDGGSGDDFTAALEECGVDFGGGGFGGFGGRGGDGGGGFGGFGGGFRDGSVQECLTELLGTDALEQLRSTGGGFSQELQEALRECNGSNAFGDDQEDGEDTGSATSGPDSAEEPTATPVPPSDLSIEVLTCLAGKLDAAALASVVIATSSGDLSELADEALAALQTCESEA